MQPTRASARPEIIEYDDQPVHQWRLAQLTRRRGQLREGRRRVMPGRGARRSRGRRLATLNVGDQEGQHSFGIVKLSQLRTGGRRGFARRGSGGRPAGPERG
ncbi:MAG: hypothetical protein ACRDOI_18315 [Trebonia sp.]